MTKSLKYVSTEIAVYYAISFGVWFIVAIYAMAHDQYIVRIAPEHFTVYHRGFEHLGSANLQALAYAFFASFAPGLALGIFLAAVCRVGSFPKASVWHALIGTLIVIAFAELISASSGLLVYFLQIPLYPRTWYPKGAPLPLLITQTIQVTCYLASGLGSFLLLCGILAMRLKWKRKRRND